MVTFEAVSVKSIKNKTQQTQETWRILIQKSLGNWSNAFTHSQNRCCLPLSRYLAFQKCLEHFSCPGPPPPKLSLIIRLKKVYFIQCEPYCNVEPHRHNLGTPKVRGRRLRNMPWKTWRAVVMGNGRGFTSSTLHPALTKSAFLAHADCHFQPYYR
jgi:hypothetical protein